MALNLKNAEADRLARELAAQTGEGLTQAVIVALRERLERTRPPTIEGRLAADLLAVGKHFSALPSLDTRPEDEILGFGPEGV